MDLSSVEGVMDQLNALCNTPHTADELKSFYGDFWQSALDDLYEYLSERYGEDFSIDCEFLNVQEYDAETVAYLNQRMQEVAPSAVEYLGVVDLTVRYTVTGSKGSGMETDGYLTPTLVLFQTADGWTLGSGNGFPSPSTEALLEFFGGLKKQ